MTGGDTFAVELRRRRHEGPWRLACAPAAGATCPVRDFLISGASSTWIDYAGLDTARYLAVGRRTRRVEADGVDKQVRGWG